MNSLARTELIAPTSASSTFMRKPLLQRRHSVAEMPHPTAIQDEFQTARLQPNDFKRDFSRVPVRPQSHAVSENYFVHRPRLVTHVGQGGRDGRSIDGEENYPRQQGGLTLAPNQGTATIGPNQAGRYPSPPTVPQILADSVMAAQLQRAWTESMPNAPAVKSGLPGSLKREQGGWFQWRRDSKILQSVRVPAGTRDGLSTIVGTRPPDSNILCPVAWYHTHPNTASEGYTHQASAGDRNWQNAEAKVPGVIMTHNGVVTIPYP